MRIVIVQQGVSQITLEATDTGNVGKSIKYLHSL